MSQYVKVHMHPQFPWCTVLWYQGSYGILLLPWTIGSFLWCHHKLDEVCRYKVSFHSSPLGQNGHHFAADILSRISFNENVINFYSIFVSHLFLRGQLTINQYLFRLWLGTCFVPSYYLNQCWPSSLTHICGTRGDELTNQGWMREIYTSVIWAINSIENGLSSYQHQDIWTNVGILLIRPLGINFMFFLWKFRNFHSSINIFETK